MTESTNLQLEEEHANASPVATEVVLRALGFEVDPSVVSDEIGLSFDFGNFKLEASQNVNRWFRPVITLGGVMSTERTIAIVHFEMPTEVESFEQGVALIVHCLDSHAAGRRLQAGLAFTHASPRVRPLEVLKISLLNVEFIVNQCIG